MCGIFGYIGEGDAVTACCQGLELLEYRGYDSTGIAGISQGKIAFRKKVYTTLDELQKDLDDWVHHYNHDRTHQGKMCCGRTPMQTLLDGKKIWQEKVDSLNLN